MNIFDGHLALGVRPKLTSIARSLLSCEGKIFKNFMRIVDWRRHEFWCLPACVAEHNALITGAFILIASGIDALRDVGGLGVEQHFDLRVTPVKALLLITNIFDRAACRGLNRI